MGWLNVKSFSSIPASGTEPGLKEVARKYLMVKGGRQHMTSLSVRMNADTVDGFSRFKYAIYMGPQVISLRLWNQKTIGQMATATDFHICLLLEN